MIVISEADLGIGCDNARCTRQATYVIVLQADSILVRLYCPECTGRLTEGTAKIMRDNDIDLHDVLDVGHLLTRAEGNPPLELGVIATSFDHL